MVKRVRVIGIDDSPFRFGDRRTMLVGVVTRLPDYVEGVTTATAEVDGRDADDAIIGMLERSRYLDQIRLVMLDGASVGGFNVVDIGRVHRALGVPCATITRSLPDMRAIEAALLKLPDGAERLEVMKRNPLFRIGPKARPIYASASGITGDELDEIVQAATVSGSIPEPLRLAHLIAAGVARGESHGRA